MMVSNNRVQMSQTSGGDCVDSPAGNMIPLDSILNLRRIDAQGKLFRSARHDRASLEDIEHIDGLGIRTVFDMRSRGEYSSTLRGAAKAIDQVIPVVVPDLPDPKKKPYPTNVAIPIKDLYGKSLGKTGQPPEMQKRRYLVNMFSMQLYFEFFKMVPLFKRLFSLLLILIDVILRTRYKYFVRFFSHEVNTVGLAGFYFSLLGYGGKQLCFILKTISEPENLPALLCCAHGKDRTGIVTAMVLSILGKSDEYIAEDYALSAEGLRPIESKVRSEIVLKYRLDESFATAKKETMLETLAILRNRYGSVENYLESIGFGREDQDKLRQVLS